MEPDRAVGTTWNQLEPRNMNRESAKQIFNGQRTRRINWRADRGHWGAAGGVPCCHRVGMYIGKRLEWAAEDIK